MKMSFEAYFFIDFWWMERCEAIGFSLKGVDDEKAGKRFEIPIVLAHKVY